MEMAGFLLCVREGRARLEGSLSVTCPFLFRSLQIRYVSVRPCLSSRASRLSSFSLSEGGREGVSQCALTALMEWRPHRRLWEPKFSLFTPVQPLHPMLSLVWLYLWVSMCCFFTRVGGQTIQEIFETLFLHQIYMMMSKFKGHVHHLTKSNAQLLLKCLCVLLLNARPRNMHSIG